ncbi:hypothetical protein C2G38_2182035 [Gigaspora rosea]|uniref:Uncharacterized protein n=1 Tax=Gigaspora rosea TaxID=44941 RepID=A0A397VCD2_9GLOM|nr:hypothetical protein C2G38_2182035 [Gigaspora rosea]
MSNNNSSGYPYAFEILKLYFLWTLENIITLVFSEFIHLHIDFVARSSLESNQSSALQGALINWFTTAATILGSRKFVSLIVFNQYYLKSRCREQLLEGQGKQSNRKNVNLRSCSNEKDIENTTNKKVVFDIYAGSNKGPCDMLDFTELDKSYLAMNSEKMWRLKSERKAIFSDEECEEIFSTNVQKKP